MKSDLVFRFRARAADALDLLAARIAPKKSCAQVKCPEPVQMHLTRIDDGAHLDSLPLIGDLLICYPDCSRCEGTGSVCQMHPDRAYDNGIGDASHPCDCGWPAGIPCDAAAAEGTEGDAS